MHLICGYDNTWHVLFLVTVSVNLLIFMAMMSWSALLDMVLEPCIILSHLSYITVSTFFVTSLYLHFTA
jgi:hypothetical protein